MSRSTPSHTLPAPHTTNTRWGAVSVLAGAVVLAPGCTVINRIDACQPRLAPDFQVNVRTEDDQTVTNSRAVATLPGGRLVVVWQSGVDGDSTAPGSVRGAILRADGENITPSDTTVHEAQISTATDEVVTDAAVAVGTGDNPFVFVVWTAQRPGPDPLTAPAVVRARIMDSLLAPASAVFTLSDPMDTVSRRPALAVRADGREALAVFFATSTLQGTAPRYLRARSFGVANSLAGRVEPNGCDGGDYPCTFASGSGAMIPALIPAGDGYRLAYLRDHLTGLQTQWDLVTRPVTALGRPGDERMVGTVLSGVDHVALALEPLDHGFAAAWGGETTSANGASDADISLQRFDDDGQPVRDPFRVNALTDGVQTAPTIQHLGSGRVFVAWTDRTVARNGGEVVGRVLAADDTPAFGNVPCDRREFVLSSLSSGRRGGASLALADARTVVAIYNDTSMTGTDAFGWAVRGRQLPLDQLLFPPPP